MPSLETLQTVNRGCPFGRACSLRALFIFVSGDLKPFPPHSQAGPWAPLCDRQQEHARKSMWSARGSWNIMLCKIK